MGQTSIQYAYLIGKETTYGTGVTTDKDIGIVTDISQDITRENIEARGIGQTEVSANLEGAKATEHSITVQYQHGRLFEFIIGAASHATTGSDTEHTFTVGSDPSSFTAIGGANITAADIGWTSTGLMVDSAELSIDLDSLLTLNVNVKGKYPTLGATVPTHTISTLATFPYHLCTLKFNTVTYAQIQTFKINWARNLQVIRGIGSQDLTNEKSAGLTTTFSGTITYDANTIHGHFNSNNLTSLNFIATNGVTLGSGKRSVAIDLNKLNFTRFREVARVGDTVVVDIEGSAAINTFVTTDNIASASWL